MVSAGSRARRHRCHRLREEQGRVVSMDGTSPTYTRREALGLLARAGAGAGLLAASGALGALPALAAPARTIDRPLRVHHDAAIGPFLQPYIDKFNEMYAPLRAEGSY